MGQAGSGKFREAGSLLLVASPMSMARRRERARTERNPKASPGEVTRYVSQSRDREHGNDSKPPARVATCLPCRSGAAPCPNGPGTGMLTIRMSCHHKPFCADQPPHRCANHRRMSHDKITRAGAWRPGLGIASVSRADSASGLSRQGPGRAGPAVPRHWK